MIVQSLNYSYLCWPTDISNTIPRRGGRSGPEVNHFERWCHYSKKLRCGHGTWAWRTRTIAGHSTYSFKDIFPQILTLKDHKHNSQPQLIRYRLRHLYSANSNQSVQPEHPTSCQASILKHPHNRPCRLVGEICCSESNESSDQYFLRSEPTE